MKDDTERPARPTRAQRQAARRLRRLLRHRLAREHIRRCDWCQGNLIARAILITALRKVGR